MNGLADEADDESDDVYVQRTVEDPQKLAADLIRVGEDITDDFERLTTSRPDLGKKVIDFWRQGLDEVTGDLEKVNRLRERCKSVVAAEAETHPAGKAGDSDKARRLRDQVDQLGKAIRPAFGDALAALRSLEAPDQSPKSQSGYYMKAAARLADLGSRCHAIAKHLRGSAPLQQHQDAGDPSSEASDG
jgi:hypothetical protein